MPSIQILLSVDQSFFTPAPDPPVPEQGQRFNFTDDLVLERYDDSTPGSGLPQNKASGSQERNQES